MLKVKTIELDGHEFAISQLPGWVAWEAALCYAELEAEIIAALRISAVGIGDVGEFTSGIGRGLAVMARMMQRKEFRAKVLNPVIEQTLCDGKPLAGQFDIVFGGNPAGIVKYMKIAVEHSCAGFTEAFGEGSATLSDLKDAATAGETETEAEAE